MWTLLFILVATAAASDSPRGCNFIIRDECIVGNEPKDFPGNEQELQEFCKAAKAFFECSVGRLDLCGENDQNYVNYVREIHSNVVRVCNEESLLYRGLADSLPCLKKLRESPLDCPERADSDALENYIESLSIEGVTDFGEGEEAVSECLSDLYMFSCTCAHIGKECGGIAKDVVIEIIQGFDTPFYSCPAGIKDQLPAIANALQLEEEKEEELENALKKK